jgi:TLC domain
MIVSDASDDVSPVCAAWPGQQLTLSARSARRAHHADPHCHNLALPHSPRAQVWVLTMFMHTHNLTLPHSPRAQVGVLIMFIHDICDAPLEVAKLARYTRRETLSNAVFGLFTLIWIAARVVYFPAVVIRSTIFDAYAMIFGDRHYQNFPHFQVINGGLLVLWVLHIYWTYVIMRILVTALSSGAVADDREDDG